MDIMTIIDRYVELLIRKEKLEKIVKETIRANKNNEVRARDSYFFEKNNDLARKIEEGIAFDKKIIEGAQKEFSQVSQLLEFFYQKYEQTIEKMDQIQIKEVAIKVSAKKEELERKMEQLSQRRSWAQNERSAAYKEHNLDVELEYIRIVSDCYSEIDKISSSLFIYNAIVSNLNYRANEQFEHKGPKR